MLEDRSTLINIHIHQFIGEHSDKHAILSDRSYESTLNDKGERIYAFNLNSNSIAYICFTNIEKFLLSEGHSKSTINDFLKNPVGEKSISLIYKYNDLEFLGIFNKLSIEQSSGKVYSKSKNVYGL